MMPSYTEIRERSRRTVLELWPRTLSPPSQESLNMMADIASAVAYYELLRNKCEEESIPNQSDDDESPRV
jgi:hypothetical protein